MKIKINKPNNPPKRGYELVITTMEGDADDYHELNFTFDIDDKEELLRYIIACEVVAKSYPNGRGGGDNYQGEYWDLISSNGDEWPHECNSGIADSFSSWSVIFHDGNGTVRPCTIKLNDSEKHEIANAPRQEH